MHIDLWQSAAGIQAAVSDVLSFCDRAPAACETGGELAGFVGSRIETGLKIAYDLALSSELGAAPAIVAPSPAASAASGGKIPAPFSKCGSRLTSLPRGYFPKDFRIQKRGGTLLDMIWHRAAAAKFLKMRCKIVDFLYEITDLES